MNEKVMRVKLTIVFSWNRFRCPSCALEESRNDIAVYCPWHIEQQASHPASDYLIPTLKQFYWEQLDTTKIITSIRTYSNISATPNQLWKSYVKILEGYNEGSNYTLTCIDDESDKVRDRRVISSNSWGSLIEFTHWQSLACGVVR